jgi:hypothetical protein
MARFTQDPSRLNYTAQQVGKEFNLRLVLRAQSIFTTLLNLLPSNWISTIQGPNYTIELKAVAVELARMELALEDVAGDIGYETVRTDFLYSIVGYLVFLNGKLPKTTFDDEEFRRFLLSVIKIYFQGSIPASIRGVVDLFLSSGVTVTEDFLLVRKKVPGLDISDQHVFTIDVLTANGTSFPPDMFNSDANIRLLLDVIRPAHTLFRIRYIFQDTYPTGSTVDTLRWRMSNYYYDDFRRYPGGIRNRDRLGMKSNQQVVAEDHSADF